MNILVNDDAINILKKLVPNSIDSLITDPPAGINFMGKHWDSGKEFIERMTVIYKEVLRVLKPGAHGFVWALPRTSHWTATALEDAGFSIRDIITHCFGSGFPKSHNISKAIDKKFGAKREVVGKKKGVGGENLNLLARENKGDNPNAKSAGCYGQGAKQTTIDIPITAHSTDQAKQYDGYGTALKPASEHWILIRKPLSEKTIADNVLVHGTGGINIDGCRIGFDKKENLKKGFSGSKTVNKSDSVVKAFGVDKFDEVDRSPHAQGRFPSNFMLSHHADCVCVGEKKVKVSGTGGAFKKDKASFPIDNQMPIKYQGKDGTETVQDWQCVEDCPVKMLDEQSLSGGMHPSGNKKLTTGGHQNKYVGGKLIKTVDRIEHSDKGGASRFFKSFDGKMLCHEDCPVKMLDEQSLSGGMHSAGKARPKQKHIGDFGISEHGKRERLADNRFGDKGGASRFFYCAKSSKSERNKGLDGMPKKISTKQYMKGTKDTGNNVDDSIRKFADPLNQNHHPTVKPIKLMKYLITMITPPQGTVLDPFMGSGSTGVAAKELGFNFIGIEKEKEYYEIAEKRIKNDNTVSRSS